MPESSGAFPRPAGELRGLSFSSFARFIDDPGPACADGTATFSVRGLSGRESSWLGHSIEADGQAFQGLFPPSERFVMLTPLAGSAGERNGAEAPESESPAAAGPRARAGDGSAPRPATRGAALEEINRKLKRRSRRLVKALLDLKARNSQMVADLNLAVELQKSLLPKSYPRQELASFTHRYIPMAMVGGDFFDIVDLPDDRIGVMVSDVSGHGVAPAFITAMIKSAFDYLVAIDWRPASVMTRLNAEFSKIIETEHYVTACYAVFDFGSMSCTYCNAGHPPQLLVRRGKDCVELESGDPIIGMLDDHEYSESSVPFAEGDVLCFYTDGVIEARSAEGLLFGVEGIKKSLGPRVDGSLDGMADGILKDLIAFMKDPNFEDDITILIGQALESL